MGISRSDLGPKFPCGNSPNFPPNFLHGNSRKFEEI
jgi:hypothetical protein